MFKYDRIDTNPDNGGTFYGIDDGEGTTIWMDEDGNIDSSTPTPDYDDEYQHSISEYDKEMGNF